MTEPTDGATNMAIDEAVWLGRRAGASPPTIRFFAWAPPTVSLGYGQPLDHHVDVAGCRRVGVGIVRRLTGDNDPAGAVSYTAQAGQFQRAGFPVVLCGPGSIDQAHQPDEWLSLAQLEAGAAFMARLVEELSA